MHASAPAPAAPFLIALPTLAVGELYAGIAIDEDRPTHHLIVNRPRAGYFYPHFFKLIHPSIHLDSVLEQRQRKVFVNTHRSLSS